MSRILLHAPFEVFALSVGHFHFWGMHSLHKKGVSQSPLSIPQHPTCPVSLLLFTSPSTYGRCSEALSPLARLVVCWIDLPTA